MEALAKAGKPGGSPSPVGVGTAPEPLAQDPDRARLEADLAEWLGTRVTIDCGPDGRGRLIVEFADLEILEGVLERLGYQP